MKHLPLSVPGASNCRIRFSGQRARNRGKPDETRHELPGCADRLRRCHRDRGHTRGCCRTHLPQIGYSAGQFDARDRAALSCQSGQRGKLFAAWAGVKNYVLQLNQGDSDKQISLMRLLLTSSPSCTVFNVEPNADLVIKPMVDTANRTGSWIVTHWAHNEGLHPFDGSDRWVAHVAVDSLEAGVTISTRARFLAGPYSCRLL